MKLGEFSETANRDACRMEHAISEESYLKIQQLVKSDNGVLGKLIWEVRQYSRAPIIVVIPGSHVVKKYIDWGADLCFVRRLRKKLEKSDPETVKLIQSIRKVGYYLDIDLHQMEYNKGVLWDGESHPFFDKHKNSMKSIKI